MNIKDMRIGSVYKMQSNADLSNFIVNANISRHSRGILQTMFLEGRAIKFHLAHKVLNNCSFVINDFLEINSVDMRDFERVQFEQVLNQVNAREVITIQCSDVESGKLDGFLKCSPGTPLLTIIKLAKSKRVKMELSILSKDRNFSQLINLI